MLFKASFILLTVYFIYQIFFSSNDGITTSGGGYGTTSKKTWLARRNEVKKVFLESWHDYEAYGWGYDIYHPIRQYGENMGPKPLGWIIVDSLDTLMIMDCPEELNRAKNWVVNELDYDFNYEVNVFETTIRMLGGLLAAYHLSDDDAYLDKAVDLGNRLLRGFDSPSGIPYSSVNLATGKGIKNHADGGASSTAEVSTLQLEFKYLAKLTGEKLYWQKAEQIMQKLDENHPVDGLVPIFVNPTTGKYQGTMIRLGSRGDSYYEYLLKQYLQTNEPIYKEMYQESVQGIKKHLVGKSKPNGLTFIGELHEGVKPNSPLDPKMDHLVCFLGGLLAMGATDGEELSVAKKIHVPGWSSLQESDLILGKELTETCYRMYHEVEPSGLSPEIVVFNTNAGAKKDFYIKPLDKHNLQRPETVESLYYLYKITKDPMYREWGYEIFRNFVKHTKVTQGGKEDNPRYASLRDITLHPTVKKDNMESFWLAETLKYLYLLFDDDENPKYSDLSKIVINTEAHIFPRFEMDPLFKTGWTR
ncbi:hypothetical protein PACTADRAFT_21660, partial [Pachysolen tannophilus NRRL Y-2460]